MRTQKRTLDRTLQIPKPLYFALILSLILSYILYKWDIEEGLGRNTASTGVSTGILFSTDSSTSTSENP